MLADVGACKSVPAEASSTVAGLPRTAARDDARVRAWAEGFGQAGLCVGGHGWRRRRYCFLHPRRL